MPVIRTGASACNITDSITPSFLKTVAPIPAPFSVIGLVICNVPLHTELPGGSRRVSPGFAAETADATSFKNVDAALVVAPSITELNDNNAMLTKARCQNRLVIS